MEGSLGVTLSKSKANRRVLVGSIVPNAESGAFHCFGNDCNTSKAEILVGDCAKSSMML